MKKQILAPCIATLIASSLVVAQGIPGNAIQRGANAANRAGSALNNATGNFQGSLRQVGNQVQRRARNTTQGNLQVGVKRQSGQTYGAVNEQGNRNYTNHTYQQGATVHSDGGVVFGNRLHRMHTNPQNMSQTNRSYQLMHDGGGREYICVDGQRVYFDGNSQQSGRQESGYGSYDTQSNVYGNPGTAHPINSSKQRRMHESEQNGHVPGVGHSAAGADIYADGAGVDTNVHSGNQSLSGGISVDSNNHADAKINKQGSASASLETNTTSNVEANANASPQQGLDGNASLDADTDVGLSGRATGNVGVGVDAGIQAAQPNLGAAAEGAANGSLGTE